jgi:hypothetical protein
MHVTRSVVGFSLVAVSRFATASHAQAPTSGPAITKDRLVAIADSAFQAKAWALSVTAYRRVVEIDSGAGMAWFRIGTSLENLGRPAEAAQAYQRSSTLGFQVGRSELNLARIAARAGDVRGAVGHLTATVPLGLDPSVLRNEAAFSSIRDSAEFVSFVAKLDASRFPCRSDHTFDFWIGDFDATPWDQPGASPGGQLHNSREYEGCVIVERWTSPTGSGMSMSFFDVNRHVWRMVWDDDGNRSNDFEGSYRDGAMRFVGWVLDQSGRKILASNVLQDVSPDVVRHIYSTSSDDGKTWVVKSDGRFTRRKH